MLQNNQQAPGWAHSLQEREPTDKYVQMHLFGSALPNRSQKERRERGESDARARLGAQQKVKVNDGCLVDIGYR